MIEIQIRLCQVRHLAGARYELQEERFLLSVEPSQHIPEPEDHHVIRPAVQAEATRRKENENKNQ